MRLFLALELPEAVRAKLGRFQASLRPACPGWRWIPPEAIHLTLRFLGEVRPEKDLEHREAWREAARSCYAVRFRLGAPGVFPSPKRPRVLWVGIDEAPPQGRLLALASTLEAAARAQGFAPEEQPFRPHVTLARAHRQGPAASSPSEAVAKFDVEVECSEVALLLSELHPSGARYTRLDAFSLERPETAP